MPEAERSIILAYSRPPFNLPELRQNLDKHIADEPMRARILQAVEKSMAAAGNN